MNTPVLFLIFNRPETTIRVFETIRQARPPRLYVAADGPRRDKIGENEKCQKVRAIVNLVDWDCEVKTLFREQNLGCGKAVSEAITWFFEQEEEGIILEDDVLPHPDFFPYCEELLDKYRNIKEIGFISGRNNLYGDRVSDDSYFFSPINHVWGWATWKRTWKLYQFDIENISFSQFKAIIDEYYEKKKVKRYWKLVYKMMKFHLIDTWDYQLSIILHINKIYSIVPNANMIQNLGLGENATHTIKADDREKDYFGKSILPLIHPQKISINKLGITKEVAFERLSVSLKGYYYVLLKFYLKKGRKK